MSANSPREVDDFKKKFDEIIARNRHTWKPIESPRSVKHGKYFVRCPPSLITSAVFSFFFLSIFLVWYSLRFRILSGNP